MKQQTDKFIPSYAAWKQECKSGVRAKLVSPIRYATNEIHAALLLLKNERRAFQ